MKRPSYEPQQESCIRRRLDRGASYTVSRSSDQPADMGSVTVLQGGLCMESSSKPDPQPSTRRRIQVACVRCRKRKIRCSGDTGNGLGCSNCKSSGEDPCVFVRVNSSLIDTAPTWPYPPSILKSANHPQTGVRRNSNEMQAYHRASPMSIRSTSHMSSTPSPTSDFEYSASQSPGFNRASYAPSYPLTYDENTINYGIQPPSCILPSLDASASSSYCGGQASFRGWSSSSQTMKPYGSSLYCDTEAQASVLPSAFSFPAQSTTHPPPSADNISIFSGGTGLVSAMVPADRDMRSPPASRSNSHTSSASVAETLATFRSAAGQSQGYGKPYSPVSENQQLPSDNRDGSRGSLHATGGETSLEAPEAGSNSQDAGFNFFGMSNRSPAPGDVLDSLQSTDPDGAKFRKENALYSDLCQSTLYYGNGGMKSGPPLHHTDSGMLISGQVYRPPRSPVPTADVESTISTKGHLIPTHTGRQSF